jgi:hypothetical protein
LTRGGLQEGGERGGEQTDSHELIRNQLQKREKKLSHFPVRVPFACIKITPTSDSNGALANDQNENCGDTGTSAICGRYAWQESDAHNLSHTFN